MHIYNEREHIYFIDFESDDFLFEIKGLHIWYYQDLQSGKLDAKNLSAIQYANKNKKNLFSY